MTIKRIMAAAVMPALALGLLAGAADASEVTGTMSTASSSDSVSTSGGSIGATVGQAPATTTSQATTRSSSSSSGMSGSSAARRAANLAALQASGQTQQLTADDIIVYLDGSGPAAASVGGTGGGFDPELESQLSALNGTGGADGGQGVDSSDAVAFNEGLSLQPDQVAAVGESDGANSGKVWTTVVLGLALLGLAGYAASSYMAYRREQGY